MEKASTLETPSGKDASYENFLIGSWMLPKRLRRHIATFYAFARAIDDIADNPDLEPMDKIWRLDGFEKAVRGIDTSDSAFRKGHEIRTSLIATQVTDRHCVDLIQAFRQDATKLRYSDWDDLIGYCNLSAVPVGRYLLDLHGESTQAYPAADALCNALQVINHLQDCKDDFQELNRVYLPQDWMMDTGIGVEALGDHKSSPGLRRVMNLCLDATDTLLELAIHLPSQIRDRRFAMETAAIVFIARKLSNVLRRRDPLAERVVLTKFQFARCCVQGICQVIFQRPSHRKHSSPLHTSSIN